MVACLRDAGLDIAENPTSKKDLKKIQDQFNAWAEETGLPLTHLSRICAMSVGENYDAETLRGRIAHGRVAACRPQGSETTTCDVLVAGSGAAGFATALTAKLHGLDVLMVEKEPLFGGTTAYSAGVIWIPVNSHQKAAGVSDSREAALRYLASHVGNRLDRAKAEAFVDNAPAMLDMLRARRPRQLRPGRHLGRLSSRRAGRLAGRPLAGAQRLRRPQARALVRQAAPGAQDHDAAGRHDGRPQRPAARVQDDQSATLGAARRRHGGAARPRPARPTAAARGWSTAMP